MKHDGGRLLDDLVEAPCRDMVHAVRASPDCKAWDRRMSAVVVHVLRLPFDDAKMRGGCGQQWSLHPGGERSARSVPAQEAIRRRRGEDPQAGLPKLLDGVHPESVRAALNDSEGAITWLLPPAVKPPVKVPMGGRLDRGAVMGDREAASPSHAGPSRRAVIDEGSDAICGSHVAVQGVR